MFPSYKNCQKCKNSMHLNVDKTMFKCREKDCQKKVSIRKNILFEGKNVNLGTIFLLGYLWICKTGLGWAAAISGLSSKTVVNYRKEFREAIFC